MTLADDLEGKKEFTKKDLDRLLDSLAKKTKLIKRFAEMDAQLQDELIESFEGGMTSLIASLKRCRKSSSTSGEDRS